MRKNDVFTFAARVVITNKLYYKFFVLDKVVNSGQVDAKQISEVFWKLSEVSQHLLCPGQPFCLFEHRDIF